MLGRLFFLLSLSVFWPTLCLAGEVRGTWLTTTANDAISSQQHTAHTMRRLREIGINTVYTEVWKNGVTQYPSKLLQRTIGLERNPNLVAASPCQSARKSCKRHRDLLQESLIEAHRNGLIYIAWFEYGFMAAHHSSMTALRKQKPDWLSRDASGSEIAPNGFVWMNPLHPEVQQFLLDLVLEAIDRYDLDGIQMDDRIVWPYVNMGYDAYTTQIYANEHQGKAPPQDAHDPEWMAWRADKINAFAKRFTLAIRAKRPGLIISLSPAVYPWSWQHYLLAWPAWSTWRNGDASSELTPSWDEFIPQAYRMSYRDFASTWKQQVDAVREAGGNPHTHLLAGIRIVGDGPDASWQQLRDSIELTRTMGNAGHVLWFSRGVLDLYAKELQSFYARTGKAESPHFPTEWREAAIPLTPLAASRDDAMQRSVGFSSWTYMPSLSKPLHGAYRLIGFDGEQWNYVGEVTLNQTGAPVKPHFSLPIHYQQVELIRDRRIDMQVQLR